MHVAPLHYTTIVTHISQAYNWLKRARAHHGANSDCWHLRHHRQTLLLNICVALERRDYRFSPRQQVRLPHETLSLYSSEDSLVLKSMSLALSDFLFLGYHFQPDALCLAKVTLNKAIAKLLRLFEQGASVIRLCGYWRRFLQWARAGCELRGSLLRGFVSSAVQPVFGRTVTVRTG